MAELSLALDTPDLARHYEQASVERQFRLGKQLIDRLEIHPGEHVLDVGCGTGLLAAHVAGQVGARGRVVGVDPLPYRIALARQKALPSLQFAIDDAYHLESFGERSFDTLYLNAVLHWLDDKRVALRNFYRLLRRGGWLGLATGSEQIARPIHDLRAELLSRAPYRDHPTPPVSDTDALHPDVLRTLLLEAGFSLHTLALEPSTHSCATAEAAIDHAEASSFGNFLGHLPPSLQQGARRELARELEKLRTPEGIVQRGEHLVAIAVKE